MNTPNYIKSLVTPQSGKKPQGRKGLVNRLRDCLAAILYSYEYDGRYTHTV